jgi:hypothetical protein
MFSALNVKMDIIPFKTDAVLSNAVKDQKLCVSNTMPGVTAFNASPDSPLISMAVVSQHVHVDMLRVI